MRRAAHILLGTALLSAMAGCTGGGMPAPLSESGFADAGDVISRGSAFTLPGTQRVTVAGDEIGFVKEDLQIRINEDGNPVVLLDGEEIELGAQQSAFEGAANGRSVSLVRVAQISDQSVELIYIADDMDGVSTAGFVPFGYDTDPADMKTLVGDATYEGPAILGARQVTEGGVRTGFSEGEITLRVDFGADIIGGQARFDQPQDNALTLPDITIDLEDSRILYNSFEGIASIGSDGLLSDGQFSGRFYGAEAASVGGVMSGRLSDEDGDILLQGGFVAGSK